LQIPNCGYLLKTYTTLEIDFNLGIKHFESGTSEDYYVSGNISYYYVLSTTQLTEAKHPLEDDDPSTMSFSFTHSESAPSNGGVKSVSFTITNSEFRGMHGTSVYY
jgi:hypothetical protein